MNERMKDLPNRDVELHANKLVLIFQLRSWAVPVPSVKINWISAVDEGAIKYTIEEYFKNSKKIEMIGLDKKVNAYCAVRHSDRK